jgi:acyl carrier protein
MPELLTQLQPIFRDVFDRSDLIVTRESNAETVEGWDSLVHITLINAIEQEFAVDFALGELESLKNVGEMVDLIERKRAR